MTKPQNTEFVIIRQNDSNVWLVKQENLTKTFEELGQKYVFAGTFYGRDEYWHTNLSIQNNN